MWKLRLREVKEPAHCHIVCVWWSQDMSRSRMTLKLYSIADSWGGPVVKNLLCNAVDVSSITVWRTENYEHGELSHGATKFEQAATTKAASRN